MSQRGDVLSKRDGSTTFVMGDEAAALGALYAGCDFFGGYPITPASEVAEVMARELPTVGGYYVQFEDEMASISAVVGAAWAGGRAMTATSGPGFSLMQETIGYAAMTETPCVIVDVQRSGPSTGQATKPAQGDLMQARWGTHGDHEIIALSPWSVQECFDLMIEAFRLSEAYRTPVIFLTDGAVGHFREPLVFPTFSGELIAPRPRAREGEPPFGGALVPPMAQIGDRLDVHITGSTHKASGIRDVNSKPVHDELVLRLVDKIASAREALTRLDVRRMDGARVAVVAFGATARPALGAVEEARRQGHPVGFIRLINLWPFPGPTLKEALEQVDCVLVPEMSLGQLNRELERFVHCPVIPVSKIGGVAHTVEDILQPLLRQLEIRR
jgi:2-oxoglutarate ferredoxin oxidoreductase subunit alpha